MLFLRWYLWNHKGMNRGENTQQVHLTHTLQTIWLMKWSCLYQQELRPQIHWFSSTCGGQVIWGNWGQKELDLGFRFPLQKNAFLDFFCTRTSIQHWTFSAPSPCLYCLISFIFLSFLPQPSTLRSTRIIASVYKCLVHSRTQATRDPSAVHAPKLKAKLFGMMSKATVLPFLHPTILPFLARFHYILLKERVPLSSAPWRPVGLWDRLPLDTYISVTRSQDSRRWGPHSLTSIFPVVPSTEGT